MSIVQESIKNAFSAQIQTLYNVLAKSLVSTNGDEALIIEAQNRFKKGLNLAQQTQYLALKAIDEAPILSDEMLSGELKFLADATEDMIIECGKCGSRVDPRTNKCLCH